MKDYRERKPIGKNRPKKRPVGLYILGILATALPAFAFGVLAGWFLFHTDPATIRKQVAEQVEAELAKAAPAPAAQQAATDSDGSTPDPPLTFFDTLPKGGRAVIGSGLNPAVKPETHPAAPKPTPPPAVNSAPAPVKPAPAVTAAPKSATHAAAPAPAPPPPPRKVAAPAKVAPAHHEPPPPAAPARPVAKGTYAVQVSSYQDKRDAELARNKLMAKGHLAYIVESTVPGKGVWYRIRIGRHLDEAAAKELAGKLGKSVMVVPE